jgi:hypothetical protein
VLGWAGFAAAQGKPAFDPAAVAQAALEKGGATEFFEIVPDPDFARVRHRASGLTCGWGPNDTGGVTVFPVTDGVVRGDDVGCVHETPFGVHTLYATRYPPRMTAKAALAEAVLGIRTRWPKAKAVRPARASGIAALLATGMPPSQSAQFLINNQGRTEMTRVTLAQIEGWTFKVRYSGPVGMDSRADTVWAMALRDPLKSRGLPPYDKGPLAGSAPAAN